MNWVDLPHPPDPLFSFLQTACSPQKRPEIISDQREPDMPGGLSDEPNVVWWEPPDAWRATPATAVVGLLSGSFNPLHKGHVELRSVAAALLGGRVAFELATVNADKPPLSQDEIERRCRQFADLPADATAVAVTNAPLFVQKSVLFPGVTFVVGADTAMRIADPRFYQEDPSQLEGGLATIADQGCRFLVAARWWQGRLLTLNDVPISTRHRALFEEIPASQFCLDVSSTQLRQPE